MTLVDQKISRLEVLVRQLQGQPTGAVLTATSGSIASGAEGSVTIAHGLGATPSFVAVELEDGSWAAQFGWRVTRDATNVVITLNNRGPNAATAVVRIKVFR
jgi:hypothetical protein